MQLSHCSYFCDTNFGFSAKSLNCRDETKNATWDYFCVWNLLCQQERKERQPKTQFLFWITAPMNTRALRLKLDQSSRSSGFYPDLRV